MHMGARHILQVTVIDVGLHYAKVQIQRASSNSDAAAEPATLALTRTGETADAKPLNEPPALLPPYRPTGASLP
jgi:hypothetical protein